MSFRRQQRTGFTLTEIAIVLGVIGVVMGGIWVAFAHVSTSNRAQKAAGEAVQILAGYRAIYAGHNVDTGADITCMGVNAGAFPADMLRPGVACATGNVSTYPQTPWGVGYALVYGNTGNNAVQISFYDIPQTACIGLASAEANAPDIMWSYVGQSWAGANYRTYPPLSAGLPMTPAQIAGYCIVGNNEVSFGYPMR